MANAIKQRIDVDLTEDDVFEMPTNSARNVSGRLPSHQKMVHKLSPQSNKPETLTPTPQFKRPRGAVSSSTNATDLRCTPSKRPSSGSSARFGNQGSPRSSLKAPLATMITSQDDELLVGSDLSDEGQDDFDFGGLAPKNKVAAEEKQAGDRYLRRREEKNKLMEKERRAAAAKEREELARAAYRPRKERGRASVTHTSVVSEEEEQEEANTQEQDSEMGLAASHVKTEDDDSHDTAGEDSNIDEESVTLPGGHWKMYHCVLCRHPFGSRQSVKTHFDTCVKHKNNPFNLKWDDHASCKLPSTSKLERAESYKVVPPYDEAAPASPSDKNHKMEKAPRPLPTNARVKNWPYPLEVRSYAGDIVYGCPLCDQFFHRKDNVKRHLAQQICQKRKRAAMQYEQDDDTSDGDTTETGPSKVQCPICQTHQKRSKFAAHVKDCVLSTDGGIGQTSPRKDKGGSKPATPVKEEPIDPFDNDKWSSTPAAAKQPTTPHATEPATPKSARKRPLSESGVGDVFTPDQVVSKRAYADLTASKRRRFHHQSDRPLKASEFLDSAQDDDEEMDLGGNSADEMPGGFKFEDDGVILPQDDGMQLDVEENGSRGADDIACAATTPTSSGGQTHGTLVEEITSEVVEPTTTNLNGSIVSPMDTTGPDGRITVKATAVSANTTITTTDNIKPNFESAANNSGDKAVRETLESATKNVPETNHVVRLLTGGKSIVTTINTDIRSVTPEATETPVQIHHYFIILKTWGQGLAESSAAMQQFGPFYTLQSANAEAAEKVKLPIARFESMKAFDDARKEAKAKETEGANEDEQEETQDEKPALAYHYVEDTTGLQTHRLNVAGTYVSAEVVRHLPDTKNDIAIPISALRVAPTAYLVHMLKRFSPPSPSENQGLDDLFEENSGVMSAGVGGESGIPDAETTILGVYTIPSLATKHAVRVFGEEKTRGMTPLDRETVKMELRRVVEELEEDEEGGWKVEGKYWSGACGGEEVVKGRGVRKGVCAVWVEVVGVEGPRN